MPSLCVALQAHSGLWSMCVEFYESSFDAWVSLSEIHASLPNRSGQEPFSLGFLFAANKNMNNVILVRALYSAVPLIVGIYVVPTYGMHICARPSCEIDNGCRLSGW